VSRSPADLAHEAEVARAEFLEVVAGLKPAQRDAAELVGEWGVREIVAHLGYWSGNLAEALHHAEQGRAHEFGAEEMEVDDRNAVVARVARETDPRSVTAREEAAFSALMDRLRRADPDWLALTLADGETIGHLVQEDGIDHYREHAADVRKAAAADA
jgi:mycothiol maleylpyruvate isomerase-like protein